MKEIMIINNDGLDFEARWNIFLDVPTDSRSGTIARWHGGQSNANKCDFKTSNQFYNVPI